MVTLGVHAGPHVCILMYMSNHLNLFNDTLSVMEDVRTFMLANAEDCALARRRGLPVVDLFTKPNGRSSFKLTADAAARIRAAGDRLPTRVGPDSHDPADLEVAKVAAFSTDATPGAIVARFRSLEALRVQARVAVRLSRAGDERADGVWTTVLSRLNDAARTVRAIDPRLFDEFFAPADKQYLADRGQAALLGVGGFHWTASLKGDVTETRYREDRDVRSNSKADMVYAEDYSVDEDALLAAIEEQVALAA